MPALEVLSNAVAWLPWSRAAFARASAERKPVLLSIAAAWCHWCHEMDRTSYADPSIAACINTRFVPIRVDADERPDISERYNLGGWPTTAFLTPDGVILAGGTFVPPERLAGVLAQVADAFDARGEGRRSGATAEAGSPRPDGPVSVEALCRPASSRRSTRTTADSGSSRSFRSSRRCTSRSICSPRRTTPRYETHRGGHARRHGMGRPVRRSGRRVLPLCDDPRLAAAARREAARRSTPRCSGSISTPAAALGMARFTERGADALRYIQNWLADPVDGAWWGSQEADERYYAADSVEGRRALPAPAVGRVLFTDWNAAMVSAALQAARVFDDDGLRAVRAEVARARPARVLQTRRRGVAHYFDGEARVRGLLADQIAMAAASLDAFEVSGNIVYEMMAEELAHYAIRVMWDERDGGFLDRAPETAEDEPEIGLMRRPIEAVCAEL